MCTQQSQHDNTEFRTGIVEILTYYQSYQNSKRIIKCDNKLRL